MWVAWPDDVTKAELAADLEAARRAARLRLTAAGTKAAARLLRSGVTDDTLWAATYVCASSGSGPVAPLLTVATQADATAAVSTGHQ